jgi:hypothetical protein
MNQSNEVNDEFKTINSLISNHQECYQIQIIDNQCKPILLGMYESVPLPIIKVIKYKKYVCYIISYILTKEELDDNLHKVVGINIVRQNRKNIMYSLDFIYNTTDKIFELSLHNHTKNTIEIIEKISEFMGNDKILEYIVSKLFTDLAHKVFFNEQK